jgi:hypothetical protein
MIGGWAQSLVATFVSEDHVEGMIRPLLERYGLRPDEVEALVADARANVRAWKTASGADVMEIVAAGATRMFNALGVRGDDEIAHLKQRLNDIANRLTSGPGGR